MNLFCGMNYLLDGVGLISKPGLRRFVIIPLVINVVLFTALFFVLRYFLGEFNHWFVNFLPTWLHWLSVIVWLLFIGSFFLIIVYTFVTIANFICAPFNSFLAEQVELSLTGKIAEPRTLYDNIKDIPRIVGRQLSLLGYYLPRALILFILLFIPVVQSIAAVFWFLFHAWFMTMTYLDYPTDNHRIPMRDVRDWLSRKRSVSLGFGISVMLASMVPFVNLVIIPAAVAGATKLWLQEEGKLS